MLSSLLESLPDDLKYEIILADDCSTDETCDWLSGLQDKRIKVHYNKYNQGYAATNNAAVRLAKGKVLGLLNNDLLFSTGWLRPMLQALLKEENCAGLVGNVQHRVADDSLDHAGVLLNPQGFFEHDRSDEFPGAEVRKVLAVTGACVLMYRKDFLALNGFDEKFVNGCEDLDLCFSLQAQGKAVYIAPDSRIKHHVSLSRGNPSIQDEKNSRYLFYKWRKKIKRLLASEWTKILQSTKTDHLDGYISPQYAVTPQAMSLVIAESCLRRQEDRWSRELDGLSLNALLNEKCRFENLSFDEEAQGYSIVGEEAVVRCAGLYSAHDFLVCGFLAVDKLPDDVVLSIEVNRWQKKDILLSKQRHFNVGIKNPLISPTEINTFFVKVAFVKCDNNGSISAKSLVRITHFIIGGHIVRPEF
jgi:GT2 family glycosyltransferase